MRRLFIIVVTAFGFVVVGAVPALAVEEDGTQYCGPGKVAFATARAYGNLYLKGPGDTYYSYYNLGGTWTTKSNSGPGGYWRAYISGYGGLDSGGTYSWCSGS
jgi:hypothetical protein